jgi:hypothetical protein
MGALTALSTPAFTDRFKGAFINHQKRSANIAVSICLDGLVWPAFANNEEIFTKVAASSTACIMIFCEGSKSYYNKPRNKQRRNKLLAAGNHNHEIILK